MPIGGEGETRAGRRLILRLGAPFREPRRGRGVEEEGRAEQRRDLFLNLDLHRVDDVLHAANAARHAFDHLDILADRLFARDRRQRAEDRRQETRKLPLFIGFARLADTDRLIIGLGIDIDETPVDLAPRRALLERRDRRTEGRVREYRAVDQHAVGRVTVGIARQLRTNEGVAPRPFDPALFERTVELAQREGRKGARKARGRARRGDEPRHIVEPLARAAVLPELHHQPMLLLGHARRAVERQLLLVPGKVGHRYDQVDRLRGGDERRPLLSRIHRVEGAQKQVGEGLAAEGRFEPARAHEARQLGAHLILCRFADGAVDRIAAPLHRPAGDRNRPEFGHRRQWARIGVEEAVDVGVLQP